MGRPAFSTLYSGTRGGKSPARAGAGTYDEDGKALGQKKSIEAGREPIPIRKGFPSILLDSLRRRKKKTTPGDRNRQNGVDLRRRGKRNVGNKKLKSRKGGRSMTARSATEAHRLAGA